MAAESIYDYLLSLEEDAQEISHIHFYADNTGAIQRCFNGSIGKAQQSSTYFRAAILDTLPTVELEIDWAPLHTRNPTNETADENR